MRVDAVYFIEHVARELDIACAIKHLARQRHGLNIEIASLAYDLDRIVAGPLPRLFIVPYFYSTNDSFIRVLLRKYRQVGYVNFAFEQLLSKGNFRFRAPREDVVRRNVTHLAGGEFFAEFLRAHGVEAQNVHTVGSLSCALYRPPYRKYFQIERTVLARKYGLDPDRPWVFFPENYGAAFFSDGRIEERIRNGADRAETYAYRDFARDSFERVMNWCAEAARLGTVELIVRPRPATPRDFFIQEFAKVAGQPPGRHLHFIKDGSIREWILASDIVVSSYSTSLIEAAVADRPAYMLSPVPAPEAMYSEWHDHAAQINTRDEFLALLARSDAACLSPALRDWANRNQLAAGDAIVNAVDLLGDICHGRRHCPPSPTVARTLGERVQSVRQGISEPWRQLKRWTRKHVIGGVKLSSVGHEQDQITSDDVAARVARWSAILDASPQRYSDSAA